MKTKKLSLIQLALCSEIQAVIKAADEAQNATGDEYQFLKQVSLLFNRIHVMEALLDQASLCPLEKMENLAGQTMCNECD